MSNIFLIPFHVTATEHSTMPVGRAGARVCCYVGEMNLGWAIEKAIFGLKNDGLCAERILEPVERMDISQWAGHVTRKWAAHAFSMLDQAEFEAAIEKGLIVYSPLAVYSDQSV